MAEMVLKLDSHGVCKGASIDGEELHARDLVMSFGRGTPCVASMSIRTKQSLIDGCASLPIFESVRYTISDLSIQTAPR